jgi:hypothetical protein
MTNTRFDALFKKETVNVDVQRSELAYSSRLRAKFCVSNIMVLLLMPRFIFKNMFTIYRESLHSLQGAGGAYCLVSAGKDHALLGGSLRNFSEGDIIRVIRPKNSRQAGLGGSAAMGAVHETGGCLEATGSVGYGLKLTFDLPLGKAVGVLKVRACWHDIVFRNEFGFTESMFLYS